MLGVLVNALAILAGGSVGLLAKKGIPEKITNAIMTAIALCVLCDGVAPVLRGRDGDPRQFQRRSEAGL